MLHVGSNMKRLKPCLFSLALVVVGTHSPATGSADYQPTKVFRTRPGE